MHSRLAHHSHTISIQLVSRIWGLVGRASRNTHKQQHRRTTLTVKSPLSLIPHTHLSFLYSLILLSSVLLSLLPLDSS